MITNRKSPLVKPHTLVSMVQYTSRTGDLHMPDRSLYSIMCAATSEVGELAQEVAIESGDSYKDKGADGVVGEALDVIIACLDMIYKAKPGITEEAMIALASPKCEKWLQKIEERAQSLNKEK